MMRCKWQKVLWFFSSLCCLQATLTKSKPAPTLNYNYIYIASILAAQQQSHKVPFIYCQQTTIIVAIKLVAPLNKTPPTNYKCTHQFWHLLTLLRTHKAFFYCREDTSMAFVEPAFKCSLLHFGVLATHTMYISFRLSLALFICTRRGRRQ